MLVVGVDAIELRRRLVVDRRPCLAAVEACAGAAVVSLDHPVRIGRIDPEIMVIAVGRLDLCEAATAVGRFPKLTIGDVDSLAVAGIGEYMRLGPVPRYEGAFGRDGNPALAVSLRWVESRLLGVRPQERPDE